MKPYLIVEWNDVETEARGWLCVYNLVRNYAGGGIRMHPTVTKEEVIRLARMMAYKYNAANADDAGGCKAGIVYDSKAPDAYDVLKRFISAIRPFVDLGLGIGSDLGTKQADVYKIFGELKMRSPATRSQVESPVCQKGRAEIDRLITAPIDLFTLSDAMTGYGVAYAADEAWKRLGKTPDGARVVIQGFGAVGASAVYQLQRYGYKIVGIADAMNLVTCDEGLNVAQLIAHKNQYGEMDPAHFEANYQVRPNRDWLDIDCDILIPAALEDVVNAGNVARVKASLVVEAANIPTTAEADLVFQEKSVALVPDFIANVGAIRFFHACRNCKIDFTAEAAVRDIEANVRQNVGIIFDQKKLTGQYERTIALKEFEPTIQTEFEFAAAC